MPLLSNPTTATAKSVRTRRQLLDAAARTLLARGYSQTRLSDIVESVGIHRASIYYHFESKDALVREVLSIAMPRAMGFVTAAVMALPNGVTPLDRIVTAVLAHLEVITELGDYVAAALRVVGEAPEDAREAFMRDHVAYARFWEDLLESARKAGQLRTDVDLPLLRGVLIAAMGWRLDWHLDRQPTAREIALVVLRSIVEGVAVERHRTRVMTDALDLGDAAVGVVSAGFDPSVTRVAMS